MNRKKRNSNTERLARTPRMPLRDLVPNGVNWDKWPRMDLTQTSNGKLFVAMFGSRLRYCYQAKTWYVWDELRWRPDSGEIVARAAKGVVEQLRRFAARASDEKTTRQLLLWARETASAWQQEALVRQARSELGIPIAPDEFDRDGWLLNCLNGTLDLKTRRLRSPSPEDYLTKVCGVVFDADARCPYWERFVGRIMPSPGVRRYFQTLIGLSLTGEVGEQGFYILWGSGANGKTTAVQTIAALLGDYALDTPTSTLLARGQHGGVPNDLARLKGARFVYAAEPDMSKKLADELLKRITGGEPITARFLFREFFTFYPEFKLFLLANHKPAIDGRDHGTWRRIHLVPFTETIPADGRVANFREQYLIPELPGILNWALDGLDLWRAEGLVEPQDVRDATEAYRVETDELGDFFAENVIVAPGCWVSKRALHECWLTWTNHCSPWTIAEFGRRVRERGIEPGSTGAVRVWKGIRLRTLGDAPDASDRQSGISSQEVGNG